MLLSFSGNVELDFQSVQFLADKIPAFQNNGVMPNIWQKLGKGWYFSRTLTLFFLWVKPSLFATTFKKHLNLFGCSTSGVRVESGELSEGNPRIPAEWWGLDISMVIMRHTWRDSLRLRRGKGRWWHHAGTEEPVRTKGGTNDLSDPRSTPTFLRFGQSKSLKQIDHRWKQNCHKPFVHETNIHIQLVQEQWCAVTSKDMNRATTAAVSSVPD